jgi:hypothetical protein
VGVRGLVVYAGEVLAGILEVDAGLLYGETGLAA